MKMKYFSALVPAVCLFISCGGNAPLQFGADPTAVPDMGLPVANLSSFFTVGSFTGFTSSTQSFRWQQTLVTALNANVISPVTGVVSSIETGQANNTNNVTVYFNARYSIKVTGITNLGSVRVGDYVTKGVNTIGTLSYNIGVQATINVFVYQDGTPICPLTFYDSTSRASINSAGWITTNPCPN